MGRFVFQPSSFSNPVHRTGILLLVLNPATLRSLRLLIIPASEVFDPADTPVLEAWVREGGSLIVTGNSGTRLGERGNFDLSAGHSTLSLFTEASQNGKPAQLGKGNVVYVRDDPGMPYYEADKERPALLGAINQTLATLTPKGDYSRLSASEIPATVGMTLYRNGNVLFIDINNTDIDLKYDEIKTAPALKFTVTLPPDMRGKKLSVQSISPDKAPSAELGAINDGRVDVKVGPVTLFASISIQAED